MSNEAFERRLTRTCVYSCVAVGALLRVVQLGDAALFGDEIHAYRLAIQFDPLWLATHFTPAGGYAPYSLYNEFLLHSVGLSEWTLRWPSAIAGILFTALAAKLALRHLSAFPACLWTAFLSLSPYLVYLAREARTYTLAMLAFTFAVAQCFAWLDTGRRRNLIGAAISGCGVLYFHPGTAPSVICLALLPIAVAATRGEFRRRLPDLTAAGLAFAGTFALLIAPALPTIVREVRLFQAAASADLETFRGSMMLATGLPLAIPATVWLGLALLGIVRAWRMNSLVAGFAAVVLLVQLGVLFRLQSVGFDVPWFFLRYSVHLLPVFALLCILAVTPPARWTGPGARGSFALLILLAAGVYGVDQQRARHYALGNNADLNVHPLLLFVPATLPEDFREATIPAFYRETLPQLEAGALIEAPLILAFPLYSIYQREHGRAYDPGALGGRVQKLFRRRPGQNLAHAHYVPELDPSKPPPARYLVLHKRVWEEIGRVRSYFQAMDATSLQFTGLEQSFNATTLQHRFGPAPLALDPASAFAAFQVYEDATVAVYDLHAAAQSAR